MYDHRSVFFPHFFSKQVPSNKIVKSKEPISKFTIDSNTKVTIIQDSEIPNKIEIQFGENQNQAVQLALQSRIDANRWITGINVSTQI